MPKESRRGPRQGDVLLVPIAQVRGERIQPTKRKHILVHGEQTGHHHWVNAGPNIAVFLDRTGQFITGDSTMQHHEHDASAFSGSYEVVQQRRTVNHLSLRVSD